MTVNNIQEEPTSIQFIFTDYSLLVWDDECKVPPGEYSGTELADAASSLGRLQMKYAEDWRFKDMFHADSTLQAIIID